MNKDKNKYERYKRQIILNEFGIEAQQKLLASKVLVVGAGGLGCAALQYLAAAGIGTLGIIDDDIVSLDNLHRQILYTTKDIGLLKSEIAKEKLLQLNPNINIIDYCERLTTKNALHIFAQYDIIIDGTDNFASRYLINDACVLLNKPLVYGAVSQYEGQLAIFNIKNDTHKKAVNYRDLFPEPPKVNEIQNCEEAGVLGVLPGIIGIMQASETIKLITGIGEPLVNLLLTFNVLSNEIYVVSLTPNEQTSLLIPANGEAFVQMNYERLCSFEKNSFELDIESFDQFLSAENLEIIDVREIGEQPGITEFRYTQIPFSQLDQRSSEINSDTIIVFCQSGNRSIQAARQLISLFGKSKIVYSLQGGILNWLHRKKTQHV